MAAARPASAYATARDSTVSWALRPDGLGTTNTREAPQRSACSPTRAFGSAKAVSRAGLADLRAAPGISDALAETIYGFFHGEG